MTEPEATARTGRADAGAEADPAGPRAWGLGLLQTKLTRDIAWTIGGLVVLAGCGILINIAIARFRDAATLGAFSQTFALYVITSQIAAFGLPYSVMRHTALYDGNQDQRNRLLVNAVAFTLALGAAMAVAAYALAPAVGWAYDSPVTGACIRNASWGLLLCAVNRVLLAYLNGMRYMRAFALLQSARYVVTMLWVVAVTVSAAPFELAAFGFAIAECVAAAAAAAYILGARLVTALAFDPRWTSRHLAFGGKSLLGGLFVELNARVDVMLAGLFLSDRAVGIYSFAAMFVDGLYHVLAMVRLNFNPILVAAARDNEWPAAQRLLAQAKRLAYPVIAALAALLVVLFLVLAHWVVPAKGLHEGMIALLILAGGIALIAPLVPFDQLMVAIGYPGLQTLQYLAVVASNIALNVILVPRLGIEGAALAAALSGIVGIAVLVALAAGLAHWNLLTNRLDRQARGQ